MTTMYTRPIGTFDSPLDLAMICAISIPLLRIFRQAWLRYSAMILLLFATVLSESRVPTLLALIGATYLVATALRSVSSAIAASVIVILGVVVALSVPIFSGLLERLTGDDGNSAAARQIANNYIIDNLHTVFLIGNGWGESYQLKGSVLSTSLENGYAILAFDIGGLVAAALLLTQLRILTVNGGVRGSRFSGLGFIIAGFAYSGIVNMSAVSLVGWLVLAANLDCATKATSPTPKPVVPHLYRRFGETHFAEPNNTSMRLRKTGAAGT